MLQSGVGLVVGRWTPMDGPYPSIAYQAAFGIIISLQITALLWFVRPDGQPRATIPDLKFASAAFVRPVARRPAPDAYKLAAQTWAEQVVSARAEVARWRLVAIGTGALCVMLSGTLVISATETSVVPYMATVDQLGTIRAAEAVDVRPRSTDAQIALLIAQFVEDIRSLSTDPVVVRTKWSRAYAMATERGADALNRYVTGSDRFTEIGKRTIIAKITSVVRASENAFEVHWQEFIYESGAPFRIENLIGLVTVVFEDSGAVNMLVENPLGAFVDKFEFSRFVNAH